MAGKQAPHSGIMYTAPEKCSGMPLSWMYRFEDGEVKRIPDDLSYPDAMKIMLQFPDRFEWVDSLADTASQIATDSGKDSAGGETDSSQKSDDPLANQDDDHRRSGLSPIEQAAYHRAVVKLNDDKEALLTDLEREVAMKFHLIKDEATG